MDREEAIQCLNLLTEKLGIYFQLEFSSHVYWPLNIFPDQQYAEKSGTWFMHIVDKAFPDDQNNVKEYPKPMLPVGIETNSIAFYTPDNGREWGFYVNALKYGDTWLETLVLKLSGHSFKSERKKVSVPVFSSYEELKLKLEI